MNTLKAEVKQPVELIPNGPGAAAILAAGIGCGALGVLAFVSDASTPFRTFVNFYNPTGPLSGVTTLVILIWLVSWTLLAIRWRNRTVALGKINIAAFIGLALGLLLTFPPFADLL